MSLGSMTAVEDRQLPLRKRADLEIAESMFQLEKSWIVKDPISLKYHRLREAEILVLNMLDGTTTLREIKEALQEKFPTKIARITDLQQLLSSLFRAGMLLSDSPGQATQLLRRHRETQRREWLQRLSNVLAIRFPGFDPERLLQWLHPWFGWIFDRVGITLWLVLATSAGALLLSQFDTFQQKLPAFYEFFSVQNFFWLALVMATTKICHELGHGLSCKHFGGECHEIGLMLLVFTPAMYCDTSDSWLLPNKWHRAFIGAAGMYVEVFLASIATFLWWYTQPGLFNYLCLNVIFVSSVSTIIFNANPLLRYDGYYILSDILEIPNLAQKSRLAMLNLLRVGCLGLRPISPRQLPQRNHVLFAAYSVASFVYRWFVLVMIVWFVSEVFEPYGLEVIGHMVIAMSVVGLIFVPLWRFAAFLSVPGRIQEVKWPRVFATVTILALVGAGVTWIPLPRRVITSVVIRPDQAERVYVEVPGRLDTWLVRPGDTVSPGQTLTRLHNPSASLRVASLRTERDRQQTHLDNLRAQQASFAEVGLQIPAAESALQDLEEQLSQVRDDQSRLSLTAHRTGTVMLPPEVPAAPERERLGSWHGTPFDPHNQGATLEVGTLACLIGDPATMRAVLVFDQRNVRDIHVGLPVEILLDAYPGRSFTGTIEQVAKIDMELPPRELWASTGGPLATETDARTGEPKSMFVMYEAIVPLPTSSVPLMNGFRGQAKIEVASQPLFTRLLEMIRNAIHFR